MGQHRRLCYTTYKSKSLLYTPKMMYPVLMEVLYLHPYFGYSGSEGPGLAVQIFIFESLLLRCCAEISCAGPYSKYHYHIGIDPDKRNCLA